MDTEDFEALLTLVILDSNKNKKSHFKFPHPSKGDCYCYYPKLLLALPFLKMAVKSRNSP